MFKLILTMILLLCAAAVTASDLAVTVYNRDLGVVSENRTIDFEKGTHQTALTDIPSRIDAGSVKFEIPGKSGISILEQNYAFDLMNPEQMYAKYIDKPIELIDTEGNLHSGILLSYNRNNISLKDDNGKIKIIMNSKVAQTIFDDIPDGMITKPTLFWIYQAEKEGEQTGKFSYQTGGFSWNAEYVAVISDDDTRLHLSGWASILNQSGMTYKDVKLKLIAGDINRARPQSIMPMADSDVMTPKIARASFEEKTFFDYHMYTLPRKATLIDKSEKQVSLFEPAETSVEKFYKYQPDQESNVKVAVKFTNSEKDGLGMPLPSGRFRIFKADDDGAQILLGEDSKNHIPKDEEVTLNIGTAFDIVGKSEMLNQIKVSDRVIEKEFSVEIRNRKEQPVTVNIEKQFRGDWEIISADFEYTKANATTLKFNISAKAGEVVQKVFKVRINL